MTELDRECDHLSRNRQTKTLLGALGVCGALSSIVQIWQPHVHFADERHSLSVEIEKGSGLRSVKCEAVGTHKRHSLSVEIDKGNGLRSVKCEAVGTHERHSHPVEIKKGSGLRSVKFDNVGTHERHSHPVEIEKMAHYFSKM